MNKVLCESGENFPRKEKQTFILEYFVYILGQKLPENLAYRGHCLHTPERIYNANQDS